MIFMNQIKSKFRNLHHSYIINIIFIAIIFTACLWDVSSLERIRVVDDGFCYWGIAATFSGYDWTDLISASAYYSYGYSIILIPLLWLNRLGLSITIVYRLAIVLNACFLSGCYLMALYMIKELFKDIPDRLGQVIALFATLYIGNTAQMGLAWTETFLLFMFWCVLVLLYRVIKKPGYGNILGLAAAVAWLFAIHMRAIGIVIAVCMVMLLFFISRHREINKKYIIYTLGAAAFFFVLTAIVKSYVTNSIYLGTAVNSGNNVKAGITRVGNLLSIRGILDVAVSVIGKLFYVGTASFLLIFVGVLAVFLYLLQSLIKKNGYGQREKWQPKEWMTAFILLSFLAQIGIEAIYQCIPFFRSSQSHMLDDTFAFGRYADFVMGPMIIIGMWTVYNTKKHYKEIMTVLLVSICITGTVQFFYNILSARMKRSTVGFRFAAAPWLSMLADGHKTDFACAVMMLSIAVLLILCMFGLISSSAAKTRAFGAMMLILAAVWCSLAVAGGVEYTESKIEKEKTVDTVARIVEVTGEDTPVYMFGDPNTEVKILQWLLPSRSIHICSLEELSSIDTSNAVILANSADVKMMSELSGSLDFLYNSGYISVYADSGSGYYGAMADMADKMAHVADPKVKNISLETLATEYSYTKTNGGLYYNYQGSDGGYMTGNFALHLEDGIYDFAIDMRVRECEAGTQIGYITVGDVDGNIQYTQILDADDFLNKPRQTINVSVKIKDWAQPFIGIYTYGNSAIKICDISYRKSDGCIQLDSDEIEDIAAFLGEQGNAEACYIDSDNSGLTGFPWWKYGKLEYISGAVTEYKEDYEDIPYIAEKTDADVIASLEKRLAPVYETGNYIVFAH